MMIEQPIFLQKRLNFFLTVAVLFTTLFSWYNQNSWCIILLAACRLFDGKPLVNIRTAFSNKLFVAFFVFFLIEAAGFLHTHDPGEQGRVVSKDATLVAIAFVCCGGRFADGRSYRKLLDWYYFLLLAASVYCLVIAFRNYWVSGDTSVFFYHLLTRPISQNAVFFSVYVVFGLLFLLSPEGKPMAGRLSGRGRKVLRFSLGVFFLGMILLLSSKLLLVIALLILVSAFLQKYSYRKNKRVVLVTGSVLLLSVGILALTNNPISTRYRELAAGELAVVKQEKFNPGMYFNALQLRLLEWRFAFEIMNARGAWVFGVSPGDSQDLLNEKYVATNMYIGNPGEGPHRKVRGYIGYNFHNQYLETLVRTGLVGLASLLVIMGLLIAGARRHGTKEGWFVVLTIAVFFIPEAPLTLQHGIFLFCFFPLLALCSPCGPEISPE